MDSPSVSLSAVYAPPTNGPPSGRVKKANSWDTRPPVW